MKGSKRETGNVTSSAQASPPPHPSQHTHTLAGQRPDMRGQRSKVQKAGLSPLRSIWEPWEEGPGQTVCASSRTSFHLSFLISLIHKAAVNVNELAVAGHTAITVSSESHHCHRK